MSYAKERGIYKQRLVVMFDFSKALKALAKTAEKFNLTMNDGTEIAVVLRSIADNLMIQIDSSADVK